MDEFIHVDNLAKQYGSAGLLNKRQPRQVLDEISLAIAPGESVALVGASGSGKSTLCRLLLGIEPPSQGEVYWQGKALSQLNQQQWRAFRQQVQLVFQDSIAAVNPRQSVLQILSEPMIYLRGLNKPQRLQEAKALINLIGLDPALLQRRAGQLSGGQLQRIAIARALAAKPQMIALDESLSSLDLVLQQQIISLLKTIQAELGTAYLLVTHDLRLVDLFCQRVIVLDSGRIVENRQTGSQAPWTSEMGQTLHSAILPAMPASSEAANAVPA